jgi:O-antigen/teichoic acid export membrane protein
MSTLELSLVGLSLRLALMGLVVVNALLLARMLGPQQFGEYFLFLRVVSVLAVLGDLGLSQSANAFFGRHKEWRRSIHRIILRFVPRFWLGTSAIAGVTLWLAGDVLLPHLAKLLILMAFVVLPLSLYANLWNSMMIGMGRIWRVNLVQLVMCSISLLLTILFVVVLSGRVIVAAIIYSSVMLAQFLVMLGMAYRISADELSDAPPAELAQKMLSFGLRGYLGSLSYLLWTRAPVFILNVTHGPGAVGIFSIAQQLTEKMRLPVQSIQDATYQKMSVLPGDMATLAMNRYLRLTWWGMVVVVFLGALLAPWAVVMLLGSAYAGAGAVVLILLAGTAFIGVSQLLDAYFVNQRHRPGLVSILAWINVGVGLTLAILIIPQFGEKGAAAAVAFTNCFGSALYVILYLRVSGTSIKGLLVIGRNDVMLLREQMASMLRWSKGGE